MINRDKRDKTSKTSENNKNGCKGVLIGTSFFSAGVSLHFTINKIAKNEYSTKTFIIDSYFKPFRALLAVITRILFGRDGGERRGEMMWCKRSFFFFEKIFFEKDLVYCL